MKVAWWDLHCQVGSALETSARCARADPAMLKKCKKPCDGKRITVSQVVYFKSTMCLWLIRVHVSDTSHLKEAPSFWQFFCSSLWWGPEAGILGWWTQVPCSGKCLNTLLRISMHFGFQCETSCWLSAWIIKELLKVWPYALWISPTRMMKTVLSLGWPMWLAPTLTTSTGLKMTWAQTSSTTSVEPPLGIAKEKLVLR